MGGKEAIFMVMVVVVVLLSVEYLSRERGRYLGRYLEVDKYLRIIVYVQSFSNGGVISQRNNVQPTTQNTGNRQP